LLFCCPGKLEGWANKFDVPTGKVVVVPPIPFPPQNIVAVEPGGNEFALLRLIMGPVYWLQLQLFPVVCIIGTPLTVYNCSQLLAFPTVEKVGTTAGAADTFMVTVVCVNGTPALDISKVAV
jgi:hypothetical protein